MSYDQFNLFESVVHISEERDKRSLELALVKTLSDFLDLDMDGQDLVVSASEVLIKYLNRKQFEI